MYTTQILTDTVQSLNIANKYKKIYNLFSADRGLLYIMNWKEFTYNLMHSSDINDHQNMDHIPSRVCSREKNQVV